MAFGCAGRGGAGWAQRDGRITLHKLRDRQNRDLPSYRARIRAFVETHDFFAVSFYPLFLGLHKGPEFAEALDDLPTFSNKPIAIAETGHPAEPIRVRAWNLDFPSDPREQATFVETLLERAQRHRYRFVAWWAARDFDALWESFPENLKDLGSLWRDTGLLDEAGAPRPAHAIWRTWLDRPR